MSNIENQICQAVDIIVQRAMSQAEFDRTIQGTVLSCIDATIGKYKIKYQDSTFYAYSSNAEVTYSNGSSVYILVPGNDMSRDKTILGTTKRLGTNYINTVTGQDTYNIIGNNVVYTNDNDLGFISYDTYQTEETIVLYDKNVEDNILQLDTMGFNDYITQASHLICGATFRTELPLEQQSSGDYGIIFTLNFKDRTTQEPVSKYYVVNADKMTGNPYKLLYDTEQVGYFEIDGSNFIEVESIVLFAKNFPTDPSTEQKDYKKDIFIKNFKLYAATHMTDEELGSYSLTLLTPQGTYFKEGVTTSETKKVIQAQVKVKGKVVDPNSQLLSYYWFSEKADVTTTSSEYNSYGGQGWKCLNSEKIGTNLNQNNKWQDDNDTHYVMAKYIPVKEKRYKCVVVYDGNSFSKEVTFKNYDAEYSLEIVSDSGTIFYLDSGNPILTCNVRNKTGNIIDNIEDFKFAWYSIDNTGYYKAEQAMKESSRKLNPPINTITNFKIYKCNVYNSDNSFVGVASIKLSNLLETQDSLYTLMIENGTRVFKYDENGIGPTSDLQENPIILPELTFTIHDNSTGTEIKGESLPNSSAKWYVPNTDSMLKGLGESSSINMIEQVDIFTGTSLSYDVAETYQIDNQRNNIELKVDYEGNQLIARTNFLFIKEGESGTNGTSFVCRIVPNVSSDKIMPKPQLIANIGKKFDLNFNPLPANKWFRAQLWRDGDLIFDDWQDGSTKDTNEVVTIFDWSIMNNKYGRYATNTAVTESSNINVSTPTVISSVVFDSQPISKPSYLDGSDIAISNIVRVGLKYGEKEFYSSITIPTIEKADGCTVDITGGFDYVIYGSDGSNPKYDNSKPFIISIYDTNGVDISSNCNFNWSTESYIYEKVENNKWIAKELNLLTINKYKQNAISGQFKNRCFIEPARQIDGSCLSSAVCCVVKLNSKLIAKIRIPVHMYLNRFGLASVNGWDGNSVTIDEDGGFILAPQMGAGTKDENNKFTGVVMGEVKEANQSKVDTGLVGYSQGQRSFFLDAETGKTILGVAGEGQIILDPTEKEAVIRSGNYSIEDRAGMEINLTQPYINFGSGRFNVSPQGYLSCSGAKVEGEIHAIIGNDDDNNKNEIKFSDNDSFIHFRKKSYDEQYSFECRLSPNEFYIRSQNNFDEEDYSGMEYNNGTLEIIGKITATSGTIGGWQIQEDKIVAKNGRLILYADGRILGVKGDNNSPAGSIASETDEEKTEVLGGKINFYRKRESTKEDWNSSNKENIQEGSIYTNSKYDGGLCLSSKGSRPLSFSIGGNVVAQFKCDGVGDNGPIDPRLAFVTQKGDNLIEKSAIYRNKIMTQNIEFYDSPLLTESQDVVGAINELFQLGGKTDDLSAEPNAKGRLRGITDTGDKFIIYIEKISLEDPNVVEEETYEYFYEKETFVKPITHSYTYTQGKVTTTIIVKAEFKKDIITKLFNAQGDLLMTVDYNKEGYGEVLSCKDKYGDDLRWW